MILNNAVIIILSILIGFAFGTIFSVLDHYLLLRVLKNLSLEDEAKDKASITRVYVQRYVINVVVLIVIFIFRGYYAPFNWEYILIGAALGLTLPSRFLAIRMGIEKKPGLGMKSRMTEPENPQDFMPETSEDGRVIVDDKAFFKDINEDKDNKDNK